MQKGLLNSPTDGNTITAGTSMNTKTIQNLSGPDTTYPQGMQRVAPPQKNCGCNGNKQTYQPPMQSTQQQVMQQRPMPPARQLPPAQQNMTQAKNYFNAPPTKYPRQNQ